METQTVERPKRLPKTLPTAGLPNKLRKLRISHEMTMPVLARQIGVSVQALQEAEKYGTGIGKEKWYRLADIFDIDPRLLESP